MQQKKNVFVYDTTTILLLSIKKLNKNLVVISYQIIVVI